ncbi:hypothetical protein CDD83_1543 [Cordyceps sp. RAO-2017]|nr:hypothetical protein CDD83_1543 [Cordyceps sp. RAO-2017]
MPLHLLGKKSWNVYNADNIARVRRDEARAKAAEEAEEQRMQEADAERRLAILRGEIPPPLEDVRDEEVAADDEHTADNQRTAGPRSDKPGAARRKRKRHGEDDTDFELRLARERNDELAQTCKELRRPASSAPIVDRAGHISLFGDERSRSHAEKNEEAEKDKEKKRREYEDQYTMRFSNAAGRSGLSSPWYSQLDMAAAAAEAPSKNVWGDEDPRRRQREAQRLAAARRTRG